jgi:hypothetical protein
MKSEAEYATFRQLNRPVVTVFEHSQAWTAALRGALDWPVKTVAGLDYLSSDRFLGLGGVAVIELSDQHLPKVCRRVANLVDHPNRPCFFAVGPADLTHWLPLIRYAGFVDFFSTQLEVARLTKLIDRQLSNYSPRALLLETAIASNLPWEPKANEPVHGLDELFDQRHGK